MSDVEAIDVLAEAFFRVFDNRDGRKVDLDRLRALCIPQALMIKAVGETPEVCDLDAFVAPRQQLLESGELTAFHEEELSSRTECFGNVAQRWSRYRKAGKREGNAFTAHGWKSVQCVRTPVGWRISAVLWDDEPE